MLEYLLRGWIGVVGIISLVNGIRCYLAQDNIKKYIYVNQPEASCLASRLFGTWNFLSAAVRLACAWEFENRSLYRLAQISFGLAFFNFVIEMLMYKTAAPYTTGVFLPILISGITALSMFFA